MDVRTQAEREGTKKPYLGLAVIFRDAYASFVSADDALLTVTYTNEIDHGMHIPAWAVTADEHGQPSRACSTVVFSSASRAGHRLIERLGLTSSFTFIQILDCEQERS